jgi:hypothetical protein
MSLVLNGTDGLSDVDGSAATPAIRGTDANTGIFFPAADTIAFAEGGTEVMRIDSSGNVGVGTSSPSSIVNSVGSVTYDGITNSSGLFQASKTTTADGGVLLGSINGNTPFIAATSLNGGAGAATPLAFLTDSTERARIDSSGNLLVGTTTAQNARLVVEAKSGGYILQGTNANTVQIQVAANGNVQNSNNSYGAISDAKLKENIADATPKLAALQQVRVVNYNLIGDAHKQIGVVAQELEQIFPGMVDESPDQDAEGNDLGTTTKSVKYSVFVPMLIKAIQEQQAIILAQESALTALTARVAALEGTTNV